MINWNFFQCNPLESVEHRITYCSIHYSVTMKENVVPYDEKKGVNKTVNLLFSNLTLHKFLTINGHETHSCIFEIKK